MHYAQAILIIVKYNPFLFYHILTCLTQFNLIPNINAPLKGKKQKRKKLKSSLKVTKKKRLNKKNSNRLYYLRRNTIKINI